MKKLEQEITSRIPDADKKAFLADYMSFRDQGYSQKKAHSMAREMASVAMRQAPHFSTLLLWIRKGNAYGVREIKQEETLSKVPDDTLQKVEEPSSEAVEESSCDAVEESAALSIAKALLRLYRKRDKNAVDQICDLLAPAMGGLE